MSSDYCEPCEGRLVEIDHYGERLWGCPNCNRWQAAMGEWCRLAADDIVALRAVKSTKTETQRVKKKNPERTDTWNGGNASAFSLTAWRGALLVNRYAPHTLCTRFLDRCVPRYPRALCRRSRQSWP
jgi:hypothetical protein